MILHKEETLENYLFTYSVIINDTKIKISLSPNDNLHIWNTIPRPSLKESPLYCSFNFFKLPMRQKKAKVITSGYNLLSLSFNRDADNAERNSITSSSNGSRGLYFSNSFQSIITGKSTFTSDISIILILGSFRYKWFGIGIATSADFRILYSTFYFEIFTFAPTWAIIFTKYFTLIFCE